ncbi:MAG: hypothetical protein U1E26_03250 [Coriobacteriia bacterium]|nr:hypothetical protein [Coriobacteriia bacterium]
MVGNFVAKEMKIAIDEDAYQTKKAIDEAVKEATAEPSRVCAFVRARRDNRRPRSASVRGLRHARGPGRSGGHLVP